MLWPHLHYRSEVQCSRREAEGRVGLSAVSALSRRGWHNELKAFTNSFISPLLACTIEKDAVDSAVNHWVYTPASDSQEVEQWAANSFKLIDDAVTPDEFVSQMVATRLPYVHPDGTKQYWKIYLLPNTPGGRMAIFTHGTHAIFDARPNLNMLRIILEEIVLQDRDHHVGQLPWGEEWKNLAPGPVTATGGPRPDWGTEGMKILRRWQALRTSDIVCSSAVQS